MSLFDLVGLDEVAVTSEPASMDFSITDLNRLFVLYKQDDIVELANKIECENEEWKQEQINIVKEANDVILGNYDILFNDETFKTIVLADRQDNESVFIASSGMDCIASFLKSRINGYINFADSEAEKLLHMQKVLYIAVTLLDMYMQANYTGPQLVETFPSISQYYPFKWFQSKDESLNSSEWELRTLEIDGESPYELMKYPLLLSISEAILLNLQLHLASSTSASEQELYLFVKLWLSRVSVSHHRGLLGNPSPTLQQRVCELQKSIETTCMSHMEKEADAWRWFTIRVLLEEGLFYSYTYETEKANPFFMKAMELSELECELTGVKGRKTKYQTFDTSQLIVYANSHLDENTKTTASDLSGTPSVIKLDEIDKDNIMLENILISAETAEKLKTQSKLSVIDQIILQCLCIDVRNNNPKFGLITEQISPYITRILAHPLNWTVYSYSLLLKTYVEYESSRTKERAILQLQVLVDQLSNEITPLLSNKQQNESSAPIWERLMYLYSTGYPPFWELKKQLAEHYFNYGVVVTALNIFKELQLFENVVNCLEIMGKKDEAIAMLNEKLKTKGETPYIVCRLGELQKNPQFLERAWELSNHHFARAKRDLGDYYYERNQFAECIPHYKDALAVNMLYPNTWFKAAVAAMHSGNYLYSITCFTTLLKLNDEFGEGWSNLAGVLMKVGKYKEAYEAAQHSIRFLRDNWRVWDNYVTISMISGHYASVIEGLRMLLQIKPKENMDLDFGLIKALLHAVLDMKDPSKEEAVEETTTQAADAKAIPIDEDSFAILAKDLEQIEDHLDEEEAEDAAENVKMNVGSENDRQFLIKQLIDLLNDIQKAFPHDAQLYDILFDFYMATGQNDLCMDTLLKRTRSYMKGNYLSSEESVKRVLTSCYQLITFIVDHELKNKFFEVKMLCRSVIARCQRSYSGLEEFTTLKAYIESHDN